ncbi:MAG: RNA-binding S4 domain-containing protein [Pseudomonadota bacterium]
MAKPDHKSDQEKVRIDKWLWAARFFKTRTLAVDAVECGKVLVSEVRVKPAKLIGPGDVLAIRLGPYQFVVEVRALSDRRGPAVEAQKLYQETEASRTAREALAVELKARQQPVFEGRPTKRDRRALERFKSGAW